MRNSVKKRVQGLGQTFLFYGEIVGFVLAWFVAMWVVSRQGASESFSASTNQVASTSALPADSDVK